MWSRFILRMKLCFLSNKIRAIESDIMKIRLDASLVNDLYYCGRGDVDTFTKQLVGIMYWKIAACERLMSRYEMKLNGVVGGNS